ncbi:MAG TPA: hypothetical protein VF111_06130 [Thermoanaerobaculia bacterium]
MSGRRALSSIFLFLFASSALAASLTENMEAVEKIRGRKFLRAVQTAQIQRAKLSQHLEKQFAKDLPYSIEDWGRILRALQLVDADTKDVLPKLLKLYEAQVLAFYDADTHTYYAIDKLPPQIAEMAKGADPKMVEEMVQVHELMHAMQDQHWAIAERDKKLRTDTDAMLAYHALLEGEAVLVMLANIMGAMGVDLDTVLADENMAKTVINAAKAEQGAMDLQGAPPYFGEMLKFPYLDGLSFVVAAYRRGGWKELDRIHANPPTSTREILHPEDYFSGKFKAEKFDEKKPEGALSVEHLGEFHWSFLAGAENARGWMADRVVVMNDGRVTVETKWETPAHAKKFADAYGRFLTARKLAPSVTHAGNSVRVSYVAK